MPCADDLTCTLQCFQMGMCGVCVAGSCQCMPIDQCFDAGLPDLDSGILDAGIPDLDGGIPDLDGGLPDAFP